MKIQITVKSIHDRPSGHKLSPKFAGGIDYTETFSCKHAKDHAFLFMKVLDLSANQCGVDTGEFPADPTFTAQMNDLIQQIESLHDSVVTRQKSTVNRG